MDFRTKSNFIISLNWQTYREINKLIENILGKLKRYFGKENYCKIAKTK